MTHSMFDLTGQVALITGSSRGIGKAIALEFARAGAKVVVSSRKLQACETVRDEICAAGGDAIAVACNIGSKDEVNALVQATVDRYERIDVFVANAALSPAFGPLHKVTDDAWDKVMTGNVKSNWWFCNAILPQMAQRGSGNVILLSSIGALHASALLGLYGVSKAAQAHLARNLALEWGPKGIRVNVIAPGLIKTDFSKALWANPLTLKSTEERAALRRIGQPEEIAGVALFLASKAASFVTGQMIVADGGLTLS